MRWPIGSVIVILALLPALVTLILIFFLPLSFLIITSFHPDAGFGSVAPDWTLANYVKFLSDPFYLKIVWDTFVLATIVVVICAAVGYPVAYFLVRMQSRWKSVLVFLVVSPMMISTVIRNLGWIPILGNNGLVNSLLLSIGVLDQPLQLVGNFTGVVIGLVHMLLPFMVLSLMTVIQRIDPELEEAAISLGATQTEMFRTVILPLSRPGLLSGYLLVLTVALSAFVTPSMLGGKRVLVMSIFIDQQMRTVLNYPFAATAAVILMVLTSLATVAALLLPTEQR